MTDETQGTRGASGAVPDHFADPVGLAWRLIKSRDPDAWYAMATAGLTIGLSPVDRLLARREAALVEGHAPATQPMIIVCGSARSGTTVVAQSLIATLPVAYVNNLTSLFPRSPITANRLFRAKLRNDRVTPRSHYGRTAHSWGPNDGLYLWDRWLGPDRTAIHRSLVPGGAEAMRSFWGAYEAHWGRPVVTKVNHLNAHAALVAEAMPNAVFLHLDRDPLFLAQSLLAARRHIHGRDDVPYGLDDPDRTEEERSDPFRWVAHQVAFQRRIAREQEALVGDDRFWRISYEQFCADPAAVISRVAGLVDGSPDRDRIPKLRASTRPRLDLDEFARLRTAVEEIVGPQ